MNNVDIVLIEPTKNTWQELGLFGRHSRLEPLGIEYIGAISHEQGYKVKIIQQRSKSIEEICEKCLKYKPRWVGISSLTHTWDTSVRISQILKEKNHTVKIVVGGYHPSLAPEMCLKNEDIDFVVIGEGEYTFLELIQTTDAGEPIDKVNGIAYKEDEQIRVTQPRKRISGLDDITFPLRENSILEGCQVAGIVYPPPNKQVGVAQILYSRGCPFDCTFCCSPYLWGRKVYYRSPENVVNEIKYLKQSFDTNFLFFADMTFNLNKQQVIQLCEKIKKDEIDVNWWCMCRIDNIDQELLLKMKEAGCTKIGYGIESLISRTQKGIHKYGTNFFQIASEVLKLTWSMGITTRAFIMIGYPEEKMEDIIYTKDVIKQLPLDELRIGIFTPFPGLKIFSDLQEEKLLLTEDWSHYTTEEDVIRRNETFSDNLIDLRDEILKDFYQSDNYRKRAEEKVRKHPHLKQSYEWFFNFLRSKGIIL